MSPWNEKKKNNNYTSAEQVDLFHYTLLDSESLCYAASCHLHPNAPFSQYPTEICKRAIYDVRTYERFVTICSTKCDTNDRQLSLAMLFDIFDLILSSPSITFVRHRSLIIQIRKYSFWNLLAERRVWIYLYVQWTLLMVVDCNPVGQLREHKERR